MIKSIYFYFFVNLISIYKTKNYFFDLLSNLYRNRTFRCALFSIILTNNFLRYSHLTATIERPKNSVKLHTSELCVSRRTRLKFAADNTLFSFVIQKLQIHFLEKG